MDKIQIQKAATPVEARKPELAQIGGLVGATAPNAVVLERSNSDGADINTQFCSVLNHFAEHLAPQAGSCMMQQEGAGSTPAKAGKKARTSSAGDAVPRESLDKKPARRYLVSTGNQMIDQYKPWS